MTISSNISGVAPRAQKTDQRAYRSYFCNRGRHERLCLADETRINRGFSLSSYLCSFTASISTLFIHDSWFLDRRGLVAGTLLKTRSTIAGLVIDGICSTEADSCLERALSDLSQGLSFIFQGRCCFPATTRLLSSWPRDIVSGHPSPTVHRDATPIQVRLESRTSSQLSTHSLAMAV